MLRVEPKEKFEYFNVRRGDRNAVPERKPADQAASAILELVDGPKDMRFAMTARALSRQREMDWDMNEITERNIRKVTQFRKGGMDALEAAVSNLSLSKSKVLEDGKGESGVEQLLNPEEEKAAKLAGQVDSLRKKA